MASVLLPSGLCDRLEYVLGHSVRAAKATMGGHSNLVFAVDDVVVKAATSPLKRSDLNREIKLLKSLDGLGCLAPTLVGSHVDDKWTILATTLVEGDPGPRHLADLQADSQRGIVYGMLMGRLLRTVHGAAPKPPTGDLFQRVELIAEAVSLLPTIDLPDAMRADLLAACAHPGHSRGVAFLHGDPGLHNVLLEEVSDANDKPALKVAGLVDWELGGWGNPVADLAWLHWTMWLRGLQRHGWGPCVKQYGDWAVRAVGWDEAEVRACILAQMAILLVRTDDGTAVRNVWIDRIQSLHHMPFMPLIVDER
jgi:aminoglycoside phosphotransferase (APT) family kinase protein